MPGPRAAVVLACLVALSGGASRGWAQDLGPAGRDSQGRFLNPGGPLDRGPFWVKLRFGFRFLLARPFEDRGPPPERVSNDGRFLRENATHSVPTVTWVGHATLLVQMGHHSFLTDPTWSERASPVSWAGPSRKVDPGVALNDLPPIDFVLISHNHYDHLDLPSLQALARRSEQTRFLVPLGNGALLRESGLANVTELDWGQRLSIAGVEVHCLPAQHWSSRGLTDGRQALWSSWAVTSPERRFYFGGDTGYFPGFTRIGESLGPFDLAALPIGAYEPAPMMQPVHLNPEEAVEAARDLRAGRIVGIHFGTFELAAEPFDEPPKRFRAAAGQAGYADGDVWVLKVGETRRF